MTRYPLVLQKVTKMINAHNEQLMASKVVQAGERLKMSDIRVRVHLVSLFIAAAN